MSKLRHRSCRLLGRFYWNMAVGWCLSTGAFAQDIEHDVMFVSFAAQASVGAYETNEVIVSDFGGRALIETEGIEILVNDPWNRLWPLAVALEFFNVPIEIRWTSANRIYVELDEFGWELLYATGLGPELWKPISEHPNSSPVGIGWNVDLSGETNPSLFRGRLTK